MNIFPNGTVAWIITTGYVVSIYLTLGVVGKWQLWLRKLGWLRYVSHSLVAVSVIVLLYIALVKLKKRTIRDMAFMLFFAVLYGGIMIWFLHHPSEQIHLIEYSLLSVCFYYAFRFIAASSPAFFYAWLSTSLAGYFDETLQFYIPTRTYDLKDCIINSIAALVALCVVCLVFEEGTER